MIQTVCVVAIGLPQAKNCRFQSYVHFENDFQRNFLDTVDQLRVEPRAPEAESLLRKSGYWVVICSKENLRKLRMERFPERHERTSEAT